MILKIVSVGSIVVAFSTLLLGFASLNHKQAPVEVYEIIGAVIFEAKPHFVVIKPDGSRELVLAEQLLTEWGKVKTFPRFFRKFESKTVILPDINVKLSDQLPPPATATY